MISKMNDKDVTEDQSLRNAEFFIFHVHYLAAFHFRIPYVHHNVYDTWNLIMQWKKCFSNGWMFLSRNMWRYMHHIASISMLSIYCLQEFVLFQIYIVWLIARFMMAFHMKMIITINSIIPFVSYRFSYPLVHKTTPILNIQGKQKPKQGRAFKR